ncbi:uncharacterized protein PGTG_06498 [Puccinia graminis f. sp. tritici CRL 75-36-700-3]|uniref:Uncharacterized protein n=1 Tax=Puccinia graminis f. sp. tritici (strain CRL 75-36-700-3 / race SCCL) TaxID=418459 RepID=E3K8S5_PUCGT|nr:uncharacterized protein PGTG_06498 [Puccinia graminis f. sp. tritici CRL 75-36-700-3]EFP80542.2 hypothetical protein PGTG_06498 [Puccinia graminis f. sp. tritici CRL 75-36-700-3]
MEVLRQQPWFNSKQAIWCIVMKFKESVLKSTTTSELCLYLLNLILETAKPQNLPARPHPRPSISFLEPSPPPASPFSTSQQQHPSPSSTQSSSPPTGSAGPLANHPYKDSSTKKSEGKETKEEGSRRPSQTRLSFLSAPLMSNTHLLAANDHDEDDCVFVFVVRIGLLFVQICALLSLTNLIEAQTEAIHILTILVQVSPLFVSLFLSHPDFDARRTPSSHPIFSPPH